MGSAPGGYAEYAVTGLGDGCIAHRQQHDVRAGGVCSGRAPDHANAIGTAGRLKGGESLLIQGAARVGLLGMQIGR